MYQNLNTEETTQMLQKFHLGMKAVLFQSEGQTTNDYVNNSFRNTLSDIIFVWQSLIL